MNCEAEATLDTGTVQFYNNNCYQHTTTIARVNYIGVEYYETSHTTESEPADDLYLPREYQYRKNSKEQQLSVEHWHAVHLTSDESEL